MVRKQVIKGLPAVAVALALRLGLFQAVPGAVAHPGDEQMGEFPIGDGHPENGDKNPPGPGEADPDWFVTDGFGGVTIVKIEEPVRRPGWIAYGPYGSLLDWLFGSLSRYTYVTSR